MLLPAIFIIWEHSLCAEWASSCSVWLWFLAIMSLKLLHKEHRFASGMEFVLTHLWTLLKEMVLDVLHLNYLVTLPACGEHWAFLPVVDVERLLVESRVMCSAEVARGLSVCRHWLAI